MEYTKNPAEQTTAVTDLLLAAVALGGIFFLQQGPLSPAEFARITVWSAAFGLIGLAAVSGAAAHGLILEQKLHQRIWRILNAALALAVALFVVGVVIDLWGLRASYLALPLMLLTGAGFYVLTSVFPGIFFVFIVYEGLALAFALGSYVFLSLRGELDGAGLMAAGIFVSIAAAVVQSRKSLSFTLIWQFDHNGIYHLIQIVGLIFLVVGLKWQMLGRIVD
jgi:hypothetical protein